VPNLRAIVAGEVWKGAPDPRKEVEEYGVADITDLRLGFAPDDEFTLLFEAADVVVLPYTHFDAQSAAATHALTAQRALIVSDAGGLRELVRDARAVVRPGDASDLAAKLTLALTDDQLRSKLESDTATVRRAMSWETVVGRTFDIYCDVLDLQPVVSLPKAA
jgi:glycosyltransferase involved in cell wall biosynthesis